MAEGVEARGRSAKLSALRQSLANRDSRLVTPAGCALPICRAYNLHVAPSSSGSRGHRRVESAGELRLRRLCFLFAFLARCDSFLTSHFSFFYYLILTLLTDNFCQLSTLIFFKRLENSLEKFSSTLPFVCIPCTMRFLFFFPFPNLSFFDV